MAKKEYGQLLFSYVKPEINLIKIDGFIQNLLKNKPENGIHLLGEIALMDYHINKYLYQCGEIKYTKSIIDFYENSDEEEIINYLIENQEERLNILRMIQEANIYGKVNQIPIEREALKTDKSRKMDRKLLDFEETEE